MTSIFSTLLLVAGSIEPFASIALNCVEQVPPNSAVDELAALPAEIRDDLQVLNGAPMGERGGPLLATDAPSAAEKEYPVTRFYRAVSTEGKWLVQFEVALFSGVRTISYNRGDDGRFYRDPWRYFGGPACESLNAVLAGVTTPPGGWEASKPAK